MLELLILVAAVAAIAKTAGGRGLSPWLIGSLSVAGWIIVGVFAMLLVPTAWRYGNGAARMASDLFLMSANWAFLGLVFVYVRFVHGRAHAHPHGRWKCPECGWLNEAAFFKCESCKREYREAVPTA